MIADVNGAGKSTLYQILDSLQIMERVNTDEIVRFFDHGISFNQETVLCGNYIMKNIDRAKYLGYEVEIHCVGVETVEIAKQRIVYRVIHGGHGIPDDVVEKDMKKVFNI